MNEVEAVALKPCPFCAAPAEIEQGSDHHGEWFNLGCSRHWGKVKDPNPSNTCIAGRMFYTEIDRTEAEAISAWNTRAAQAAIAAVYAPLFEELSNNAELLTIAWMDGSHRSTKAHRARIAKLEAEVARLREALGDIVNPLAAMQRRAEVEGRRLSGMAYSIATDLGFVQNIARAALGARNDADA